MPIHNDGSPEANETFVVKLANPSGATLGSNSTTIVTIVDDDDSMPNSAPVISGTPAGTVVAGSAYEFQPTVSDADGDTLTFSVQSPAVGLVQFGDRLAVGHSDRCNGGQLRQYRAQRVGRRRVSVARTVQHLCVVHCGQRRAGTPPPPQSTAWTRSGGGQFLGSCHCCYSAPPGCCEGPHRPPRQTTPRKS